MSWIISGAQEADTRSRLESICSTPEDAIAMINLMELEEKHKPTKEQVAEMISICESYQRRLRSRKQSAKEQKVLKGPLGPLSTALDDLTDMNIESLADCKCFYEAYIILKEKLDASKMPGRFVDTSMFNYLMLIVIAASILAILLVPILLSK